MKSWRRRRRRRRRKKKKKKKKKKKRKKKNEDTDARGASGDEYMFAVVAEAMVGDQREKEKKGGESNQESKGNLDDDEILWKGKDSAEMLHRVNQSNENTPEKENKLRDALLNLAKLKRMQL